ncbi:Tho1 [Kluyveromyces lactis]|nr:Tho1 [Kluyveromyces lactis]
MLTFDICVRMVETTYWHARLSGQLNRKTSAFPDPNYSKTYSPCSLCRILVTPLLN